MLDETTYYFSIFALDQNNTIIDVQTKNIETDFKWKPSSDVVVYVPLKDDITEKTGNNTITNYNVSLTTLNGISCGYFNGSNARIETSQHQFTNTSHTLSFWMYYPESGYTGGNNGISSNPCGVYNGDILLISNSGQDITYLSYYGTNKDWRITKSGYNLKGQRHNLLFSGGVLYLDGQSVGSNSGSYAGNQIYTIGGHTTNSSCTRGYMKGYLREVIISNAVWDSTKVLEYYNKTKKYFGIS